MKKIEKFGVGNTSFHHLGIVVRSIQNLADENINIILDPIQGVKVAFINFDGIITELIEPVGEKSPVNNNIKNNKPLAHICYEVNNIDHALTEGRKNGFHCIAKPIPALAFNNRKIAWVYNIHFGLIELLETR